tara:strand:+ start:48 stop:1100 length:1053 start_codon:yes stop_codon:yes gene_type:complete
MAGILDNKTRIMDVIVTQEGRRQIANGNLRAEFLSFTDGAAFYQQSGSHGSEDPTNRIYFEATSKLFDMITLENDDSGNLVQFDFSPKETLVGGQLFSSLTSSVGQFQRRQLNYGSSFASAGEMIATASINNFKNQRMIGTRNGVNSDLPGDGFDVSKRDVTFNIRNFTPWPGGAHNEIVNIDSIEPLFTDKRMSHLPNFKFLPPQTNSGELLGDYKNVNEAPPLTYAELMDHLAIKKADEPADKEYLDPFNEPRRDELLKNFRNPEGVATKKESAVIHFNRTSVESNLAIQMFELNNNQFKKLDIIDFGTFIDPQDFQRPEKHVFFVGKVFVDNNGSPTFVNLFTFILD